MKKHAKKSKTTSRYLSQLKTFAESFWKQDFSFWIVFIIQIFFILVLYFANMGVAKLFQGMIEKMAGATSQQSFTDLSEMIGHLPLSSFFWILVSYVLVFIIVLVVFVSLSEWLTWHTILKKKIRFSNYAKYAFLTLIWWLIWGLIIIGLSFIIKKTWMSLILFLVIVPFIMYLSMIMTITYVRSHRLWTSIKWAFSIGIGKLNQLIIPLILGGIVFLVILFVTRPLNNMPYATFIILLIIIIYSVWVRFYAALVMLPLIKKYK